MVRSPIMFYDDFSNWCSSYEYNLYVCWRRLYHDVSRRLWRSSDDRLTNARTICTVVQVDGWYRPWTTIPQCISILHYDEVLTIFTGDDEFMTNFTAASWRYEDDFHCWLMTAPWWIRPPARWRRWRLLRLADNSFYDKVIECIMATRWRLLQLPNGNFMKN